MKQVWDWKGNLLRPQSFDDSQHTVAQSRRELGQDSYIKGKCFVCLAYFGRYTITKLELLII
jgi:hypothetical protein